jgi:N-acetylglucosamine kinase-like BadF-type ATPase
MLLEHMNCHSVLDMVSALYAGGKRMVASYAPLVFDAYKQGDRVAAKILQRNTRHMAALMEAAAKPLLDLQPVQIVLVGGMTHQADILRPMLCNHFANPSAYTVTFCQEPVVIGALRLAGMPNASF